MKCLLKKIKMIYKLFNSAERHLYIPDNLGLRLIVGEDGLVDGLYLATETETTLLAIISPEGYSQNLANHIDDDQNPHNVTKEQIGLNKVANETKAEAFNNPIFTGDIEIPAPTESHNPVRKQDLDLKQDTIIYRTTIDFYQSSTPNNNIHLKHWYNPTTKLLKVYDIESNPHWNEVTLKYNTFYYFDESIYILFNNELIVFVKGQVSNILHLLSNKANRSNPILLGNVDLENAVLNFNESLEALIANGIIISAEQLSYLFGVSSNIQSQLNLKLNIPKYKPLNLSGSPYTTLESDTLLVITSAGSAEEINLCNIEDLVKDYGEVTIRRKNVGDVVTINGTIEDLTSYDLPINTAITFIWDKPNEKYYIKNISTINT